MMTEIFLKILNMSFMASWLILAVVAIRMIFGKVSKNMCYVLWALVGIRLLCPFSIESVFSLIPHREMIKDAVFTESVNNPDSLPDEQIHPNLQSGDGTGSSFADTNHEGSIEADTENKQETVTDAKTEGGSTDAENNSDTFVADTKTDNIQKDSDVSIVLSQFLDLTDTSNTETVSLQTQNGSIFKEKNVTTYLFVIWLAGMGVIFLYALVSFWKLRGKIAVSIHEEDNIWICDEIPSPFIWGLVKPRIYIPSFIAEEQRPYILAHEMEHLKYHDNIWKPLGLFILTIHWFNPLVWLSYFLFCRDIEFACDERVIHKMNPQEKKNYMESLLLCSSPIHFHSIYSVAFGEISIRKRIKSVLRYKKPAAWILGIGACIYVLVAACFMTNPKDSEILAGNKNTEENLSDRTEDENAEEYSFDIIEENVFDEIEDNLFTTIGDLFAVKWEMFGYKGYDGNMVLRSIKADLNHDGIDDLVQVVTPTYNYELIKNKEWPTGSFTLHVFLATENGKYEEEPIYDLGGSENSGVAWFLSLGNEWNGCYALSEKDGKDYLIRFGIDKYNGEERYLYHIIDVNEEKRAHSKNGYMTFANDPFYDEWDYNQYREDAAAVIQQELSPWLENAEILLYCEEDELYISSEGNRMNAHVYFDKIWAKNEKELIAEYEALPGNERWEKIIYRACENPEKYITWIQNLVNTDISKWFDDYNGKETQVICLSGDDGRCRITNCNDIVYSKTGFFADHLSRMLRAMENCRCNKRQYYWEDEFDINGSCFLNQPIVSITEDMWLLPYLNFYYTYDGKDEGLTYEERLQAANGDVTWNGNVVAPRSDISEENFYILIKHDGVYRLERLEKMMEKTK